MVLATITKIHIQRGSRTGTWVTEGAVSGRADLGPVGDPLTPYMDADPRLDLDLAALPDLRIYIIDTTGERNERGLYPTKRAPYSALGASDIGDLLGLGGAA